MWGLKSKILFFDGCFFEVFLANRPQKTKILGHEITCQAQAWAWIELGLRLGLGLRLRLRLRLRLGLRLGLRLRLEPRLGL
jgi:hypothetical protein